MIQSIVFVSTVNLTTNPRILKEIKLALANDIKVVFVGFKLGNWSDEIDLETQLSLSGDIIFFYLDATRKPFFKWIVSSIIEKVAKKMYSLNKNSLAVNAYAHSKRSYLLNQFFAKQLFVTPKLIIGHTLGSLFPVYKFASKHKIPFAFDVEDYHPGEKIHIDVINEKSRRIFLLQTILPLAQYVSTASPLITVEVNELLKNKLPKQQATTILNAFIASEFIEPKTFNNNLENKLKFVWFSQNISFGRGLEFILPILSIYKEKISFELIGRIDDNFFNQVLQAHVSWITLTNPKPQQELHEYLANFDIGLAIEMNSADYNREIALTNKIVAYYQAGLYILATNTKAQIDFLLHNPNHGICFEQNEKSCSEAITYLLENMKMLKETKQSLYKDASKVSWENESKKIIKLWN